MVYISIAHAGDPSMLDRDGPFAEVELDSRRPDRDPVRLTEEANELFHRLARIWFPFRRRDGIGEFFDGRVDPDHAAAAEGDRLFVHLSIAISVRPEGVAAAATAAGRNPERFQHATGRGSEQIALIGRAGAGSGATAGGVSIDGAAPRCADQQEQSDHQKG